MFSVFSDSFDQTLQIIFKSVPAMQPQLSFWGDYASNGKYISKDFDESFGSYLSGDFHFLKLQSFSYVESTRNKLG